MLPRLPDEIAVAPDAVTFEQLVKEILEGKEEEYLGGLHRGPQEWLEAAAPVNGTGRREDAKV